MPKSFDEMQSDVTGLVRAFLRVELGKDYYQGKLQAMVITTNTVTGRIDVDSCNVNLAQDQRKIIYEAMRTIDNTRLSQAVAGMVVPTIRKLERLLRTGWVPKKEGSK